MVKKKIEDLSKEEIIHKYKNELKSSLALFITFVLFISTMFLINYNLKIENEYIQRSAERYVMYEDVDWDNIVQGVYFYKEKYYCVWTDKRNKTEIEETDYHEECHHLIDIDKEHHFCENECWGMYLNGNFNRTGN